MVYFPENWEKRDAYKQSRKESKNSNGADMGNRTKEVQEQF